MSVAGFDTGNETSCVALARKRGVDVIMNAESKRETPAIVSFGDKMRAVGVEGAARLMMNVKNTVVQVKRLIGRKFNDPDVQKDIKGFMYKVIEAPDGGCLISVMYLNEPKEVTPEQVVATILKDLKGIAEADQGSAITDCVLSVPAFFGEAERRAMLTAAELSGLKCLRLMNELTAAALNWGIFKGDLPEDQPINVVFVDVGHAALQICVAAFKKSSMEIKAHTWDRSLGGRDLDAVLVQHFGEQFKAKTGLDITQSPKSLFRMATQVTKTRQMLTINPQAPISVECLMEDTDFRSDVTREKFEELAAPILTRAMKPCEDALVKAGITAADVAAVEMVGAASRTPALVKTVADYFKQEPKRTMNSKECVSRGCSLQAAMLSPIFQVRHFDVKELYPFKVNIAWDKEDGPTTSQLFGPVTKDGVTTPQFLPSIKNVAFMRTDPFAVKICYSDDSDVGGGSREIADFNVTVPHKHPENATNVSCKVSFELDLHGLVRCTQATHCHKIEVVEEAPAAATAPKADAAALAEGAVKTEGEPAVKIDGENGDASNMDTDPPVGPPVPEDVKPTASKKQKKVSQEAAFTQVFLTDLSRETKNRLLEEEGQMASADSLQRATDEAKNALEEYTYSLRSKVQAECAPFVKEVDAAALVTELNAMENWLYEDGEDETKSVYESTHGGLKAKGEPIVMRYQESQTRDAAVQQLSNKCQHGLQWVIDAPNDPKLAHIEAGDLAIVKGEFSSALAWLEGKNSAQAALAKFDDPAVLTSELIQRKQTLENVVVPIMTKPVPPPPKPVEPETKPEADKEAVPMEEDTPPATGEPVAEGAEPVADAVAGDAAPMEEP